MTNFTIQILILTTEDNMSTPPSRLQPSAGSPEGAASPASGGKRHGGRKRGHGTTGTALPALATQVTDAAKKSLTPPPSPRTALVAQTGAGAALAIAPHLQRFTTPPTSRHGSRQGSPIREESTAAGAASATAEEARIAEQLDALLAQVTQPPGSDTEARLDPAEAPPPITVEGASLPGSPPQAAAAAAEQPDFQSPQGFLAPQTSPSSHQQPPHGSTGRATTLSPLSPSQQLQLAEAATLTPPPASAPLPLALQTEDAHREGAAFLEAAAAAEPADLPPAANSASAAVAAAAQAAPSTPPRSSTEDDKVVDCAASQAAACAAGAADPAPLPKTPMATDNIAALAVAAGGAQPADATQTGTTTAGAGSAGNEGAAAAAVAADPTPPPGAVRRPGPNRNGSHSDGEADDERSNVAPLGGPLATTPTAGSGAAPITTTRQKTERVWSNCVSALSVAVMGGAVLGAMWIYQIDQQNGDSM